jgi:site-specific recombinase XerD
VVQSAQGKSRGKAARSSQPRAAFSEQSEKRGHDYLTAAEIEALERAAKSNRHGARDWLAVRMAYRHGLRASELADLQWRDIDLDGGKMIVRRLKGGKACTHWLDDGQERRALRALRRSQPVGTSHVFLSERGGPWSAVGFSRMIERAGDQALPGRGVHAHMLRHSCGHHLAASGIDTRRIQDYLGHASISSTQIYTQLQSIHLKGIWK